MRIHDIEQRTDEWFAIRHGRVTGTGLKNIVGSKLVRDNYFYEYLAERLSTETNEEEKPLDRGVRLEDEAVAAFEKKTGKLVTKIGFTVCDKHDKIASSPDGLIKNGKVYNEAVEVKCLSSGKHVRAWLENAIPKEYYAQGIQYFIVNENLHTLYFVFYDPRITKHPLHIIELYRDDVQQDIEEYFAAETTFLEEVEQKLEEILEF